MRRILWIALVAFILFALPIHQVSVPAWALSSRVEQALASFFNSAGNLVRLIFKETSAPALSTTGTCVFYADSASHAMKVSCNGGAFGSVGSGGSSVSGADNEVVTVDGTTSLQTCPVTCDDNGVMYSPDQNTSRPNFAAIGRSNVGYAATVADCPSGYTCMVDTDTTTGQRMLVVYGDPLSGACLIDTGNVCVDDDQILVGSSTGRGSPQTLPDGLVFYTKSTNAFSDGASATKTLTNTTFSASGTGNVLGVVDQMHWMAASCRAGTASSIWNLPGSNAPAAACFGSTINGGVLDFDANTDESAEMSFILPSSTTGLNTTAQLRIFWNAAATSGAVIWCAQMVCASNSDDWDTTFATADCAAADTADGTTNQMNVSATITPTNGLNGCTAQDVVQLKIYRDADAAGDTMTGDAHFVGASLEFRRDE